MGWGTTADVARDDWGCMETGILIALLYRFGPAHPRAAAMISRLRSISRAWLLILEACSRPG